MDLVPFKQFLEQRQSMCKYKHGSNTTCAFCSPPPLPSFTGKSNCNKGHAPWPQAVCLSCAPANAILKLQHYRHCDMISIDPKIIMPFYAAWTRSHSKGQLQQKERAAILLGRFQDGSAEVNNPGAVRASVQGYYEPPQESVSGGVQFLTDPNESIVHQLAKRLGLQMVGWMLVVPPRPNHAKYAGKLLLTANEIQQAARFQHSYADEHGYSKFVTVIIEHQQTVEPVAFQVSDVCQALQRDGVLTNSSVDPLLLATREPKTNELVATIVYRDKPLPPNTEYLADDFLVKVIVSAPKAADSSIFANFDFPSRGKEDMIRFHLQTHAKDDYTAKFADFNLLCALVPFLGLSTVYDVCDAIKERKSISSSLRATVDTALKAKGLI